MIAYLNGQLCPLSEAKVSVLDRGFLFGDGVYEVVRCYHGRWFRMKDHSERLARSLKEIGVDTFDSNWLEGIGDDLLAANGKTPPDAILYLQVTRGSDVVRSHFYPDEPIKPTVFGMLRSIGSKQPEAPAAVRTVEDRRWGRCDIKSTSLLGHVMAANDAKAKGAHEAVLVRDGMVTEGSCTNVAVVVDGQVMTHPESPRILSGISRKVVLEICAELKIPVIERSFRLDEMKRASEVFLMGTTHEVWPVMSIDGTPLPIPAEGGLTQTLRTRFSELARAGFPPV
jgi:D-alanine transaminase